MYELAIIGGGPAGVAAGVYAARKRLQTVLIAQEIGGQSLNSTDIQNWIGTQHISGMGLAKSLEVHLRAYAQGIVDLMLGERLQKIEKKGPAAIAARLRLRVRPSSRIRVLRTVHLVMDLYSRDRTSQW
jgi:alkyl hydroperoxide reductase subunit AhpF